MATAMYDTGRNAFLLGDIDWVADDIRLILIDSADYTVNFTTDDFLNDIPGAARVAVTAASIAGKSAAAGVADATDTTFTAVTGDQSEALVLYRHTGTESTSQLIAYIDSASATGLPITPNGGNITVAWDNGANKIFKL
jgi:hypothetical protein